MNRKSNTETLNEVKQRWAWIVILCVLPVMVIFALLGDPMRGMAAAGSAGVILTVGRVYWVYKSQAYFWYLMFIFCLLHILLVFAVHWGSYWPSGGPRAFALLPIAVIDYLVMYGCLKLVTIKFSSPK